MPKLRKPLSVSPHCFPSSCANSSSSSLSYPPPQGPPPIANSYPAPNAYQGNYPPPSMHIRRVICHLYRSLNSQTALPQCLPPHRNTTDHSSNKVEAPRHNNLSSSIHNVMAERRASVYAPGSITPRQPELNREQIGINYFGQQSELNGCINDARNVERFLCQQFGYQPDDIVVLVDDARDPRSQPTRQNIVRALYCCE